MLVDLARLEQRFRVLKPSSLAIQGAVQEALGLPAVLGNDADCAGGFVWQPQSTAPSIATHPYRIIIRIAGFLGSGNLPENVASEGRSRVGGAQEPEFT